MIIRVNRYVYTANFIVMILVALKESQKFLMARCLWITVRPLVVVAKISLLNYFKPVLPSPAQAGTGESATEAANKEVDGH